MIMPLDKLLEGTDLAEIELQIAMRQRAIEAIDRKLLSPTSGGTNLVDDHYRSMRAQYMNEITSIRMVLGKAKDLDTGKTQTIESFLFEEARTKEPAEFKEEKESKKKLLREEKPVDDNPTEIDVKLAEAKENIKGMSILLQEADVSVLIQNKLYYEMIRDDYLRRAENNGSEENKRTLLDHYAKYNEYVDKLEKRLTELFSA